MSSSNFGLLREGRNVKTNMEGFQLYVSTHLNISFFLMFTFPYSWLEMIDLVCHFRNGMQLKHKACGSKILKKKGIVIVIINRILFL